MEDDASLTDLRFVGESLCLDFVNTIERGVRYEHHDWIGSYESFIAWAIKAETLSAAEAKKLLRESRLSPAKTERAFKNVLRCRDILRSIFQTLSKSESLTPSQIDDLNLFVSEAQRARKLEWNGRAIWTWRSDSVTVERALWPIVISALDLLTSEDIQHTKKCANPQCSWMFVDRSKNKQRRWCEMAVCGNQSKARGHYERRKGTSQ